MPFDEDLDVFLQVDDFADAAIYTPVGGTPKPIVVDFHAPYYEPLGNLVESSAPWLSCKASDVPNLAQGDSFIIDGVTYTSSGNEPDWRTTTPRGLITVRLELQ
jgi:hypothetical protein